MIRLKIKEPVPPECRAYGPCTEEWVMVTDLPLALGVGERVAAGALSLYGGPVRGLRWSHIHRYDHHPSRFETPVPTSAGRGARAPSWSGMPPDDAPYE